MKSPRPFPFVLALLFLTRAAAGSDDAGAGRALAPHDVFELRVDRGNLTLSTQLPPTPTEEMLTVRVPSLRGAAEVIITGDAAGRPDAKASSTKAGARHVPKYFRLQLSSDEVPGQRVAWQVAWGGDGALDVQRSVYFTGANRYTRITRLLAAPGERRPRDGGAEGGGWANPVQLFVTETGTVDREKVNVYARGDDFFRLLRAHPTEVEQFVRPMLRELGQEAVFAPELPVAWQVFASHWTPPERLKRDVAAALPGLDAEAPAARAAASTKLSGLGQEGALLLMQLDRGTLTPEQNSRIDAVIGAHAPLPQAEALRLRDDVPFLLDCLNCDDRTVRAAALERLRAVTRRPVELDVAAEGPTRYAAVAKLREQLGR